MALFQRSARTPEEVEKGRPLGLPPSVVAELSEAEWYARAYRGDDVPQLTVRAVGVGSLLGFLLAFTNVYVGLKTGWGLNVAITACILSFSLWGFLVKSGVARTPMSILENNCMQSTASAAGYSTGNSIISAFPALLLLSVTPADPHGKHLPWLVIVAWTFCTAVLGVVMAIPGKRNLINRERLRFPSGIAAAVTLQSLYGEGREAARKAKALLLAALPAGLLPLLVDLNIARGKGGRAPLLPDHSALFDWLPGGAHGGRAGTPALPSDWAFVFDHHLVMIAAGVLSGLRACVSMVLGGLLLGYIVGPAALGAGAAHAPATAWKELGIWIGAPMMVAAGLMFLLTQGGAVVRAFRGLGQRSRPAIRPDVEVPGSWFAAGTLAAGLACTGLAQVYFQIPWSMGLLAVALTFFLSLVAARATGETDITPVTAVGKMTQLLYGILLPQNATANLMTASISANAAIGSADLLTDLKSGYLLGANPRRQFLAQLSGVITGSIATTLAFYLLVPDTGPLVGSSTSAPAFPAPAAQAWLAVARVFQQGLDHLHPMARQGIGWGAAIGIGLTLLETAVPRARRFLPSPTALGLGFILPFNYPLSMLIGAAAAALWMRFRPRSADAYLVPVASGAIAGESIVGVVVAGLNNFVLK